MHLLDSLGKSEKINHTCFLHEQAAVIAAEAYGQYTNTTGVALVTTGPGGTNAITGVAGAWIDSTPLLILSGQVKRKDMLHHTGVRQMGIQEVDITSIVRPITKYAKTVMEPESIRYHLQKALYLAENGRKGPVWIDIPLDIQGSFVEEAEMKPFIPPAIDTDEKEAELKASRALELLQKSKRPVILVGNGVRASGCIDLFRNIINRLNIPVLVTWKASDIIEENHRLYCGKPGSIGQRGANFTQQNSDWIMTIGARLDLCQVAHDYSNFARSAKKIVVDIDPAEIAKLRMSGMDIDIEVANDAGLFLKYIDMLTKTNFTFERNEWLKTCRQWKEKYPVVIPDYHSASDPVNTYAFVDVLSELLDEKDLIVPGSSGACAEIVQQAFRLKKGQRLLNTPGLGSMGFGLPASIGACLASKKRRTISIIGDGGLQHNIQEFETLKRLNLPVKVFILNNGGYGSIKNMQDNHFEGRHVCCNPESGLTLPDTCSVASSYGLNTFRIKDQTNLKKDISKVIDTEGTVVCDLVVDSNIPTAPRISSRVTRDGHIVSTPMEDLWPFLDRNEFYSNMFT